MNVKELHQTFDLSSDYQTRERGESLEIITPKYTLNNKYVSVFLKKQGDEYVISDGGWLGDGMYDIEALNVASEFIKRDLLSSIKHLEHKDRNYFYLKFKDVDEGVAILNEVADFIQAVVNIAYWDRFVANSVYHFHG